MFSLGVKPAVLGRIFGFFPRCARAMYTKRFRNQTTSQYFKKRRDLAPLSRHPTLYALLLALRPVWPYASQEQPLHGTCLIEGKPNLLAQSAVVY